MDVDVREQGTTTSTMASSSKSNDDDDVGDGGVTSSSSFARRRVAVVSRRTSLSVVVARCTTAASGAGIICPYRAVADVVDVEDAMDECRDDDIIDIPSTTSSSPMTMLRIPLRYRPSLSAYTVPYRIGNSTFGAIVDTGSPFLLVPAPSEGGTCRPDYEWGCLRPNDYRATSSGLGPTTERFDGSEGRVDWMEGSFSFVLDDGYEVGTIERRSMQQSTLFPISSNMTFGIVSESLMDGPGGIFMGLVKYAANDRIRPSFLGQSCVSRFSIDLRGKIRCGVGGDVAMKALTLYGPPPAAAADSAVVVGRRIRYDVANAMSMRLPPRNAIPLVQDLNGKYGDPTVHYVGVAYTIKVNGSDLVPPSMTRRKKKLYCIFDTGCSGMSVSPSLFDARYDVARANKEKSLWGKVDVEFLSISGDIVALSAKRPITTPMGIDERPWGKSLDGHGIIVLGLAFLDGMRMVVDIDGDNIWFDR
jgi:hypothetical protein